MSRPASLIMRRTDSSSLWLGTARDARDIKGVLAAGIEAIVDLAMEEPPVSPTRELIYLRFPLIDGDGNPAWLLRLTVDAVEELVGNGVQTLIACGAGMSRSPALAAMVMSQFKGIAACDALARLQDAGPCDVSPGLWKDLRGI
jgi:hypothetical protein